MADAGTAGGSGRLWLHTSLRTHLVLGCRLGWRLADLRREIEREHRQLFPASGAVDCTGVQLCEGELRYAFTGAATLAELVPELGERQSRVRAWASLASPTQVEERLPGGVAEPQHPPQPEAALELLAGVAEAAAAAPSAAAAPAAHGAPAAAGPAAEAAGANGAAGGTAASPRPTKGKKRRREPQLQEPQAEEAAEGGTAGEQGPEQQGQAPAASEQPTAKRRKRQRSEAQPAAEAAAADAAAGAARGASEPASPPAPSPSPGRVGPPAGARTGPASGKGPAPRKRRSSAAGGTPGPGDWQLPEGAAELLAAEPGGGAAAWKERKKRLRELLRQMCGLAGVGPNRLYKGQRPPWWPREGDFSSRLLDQRAGVAAILQGLRQHFGVEPVGGSGAD